MNVEITKRDGKKVAFDPGKIEQGLVKANSECSKPAKLEALQAIVKEVSNEIELLNQAEGTEVTVEQIQDLTEKTIMLDRETELAKVFMLYRYERTLERSKNTKVSKYKLLTDDFISKYKHLPNPMGQLGSFVYYRTYSRWVEELGRREYWWETVRRAVEYNCSLAKTSKEEAQELYDNIFNMKQFLSGRTFWVGGTDVAKNAGLSNFNCSSQIINRYGAFEDMFYLLLVGSGTGFRVLKDDVKQLPPLRTNIHVTHKVYEPIPKDSRSEYTTTDFKYGNTMYITVGDSKFGWVESLGLYFKIHYLTQYNEVQHIVFNYDNVRAKGERLKTFGGTASGHGNLERMFSKIDKIIKSTFSMNNSLKLSTLNCLDFSNIIAENVVSGGARRSSGICLCDPDDKEVIEAKSNLYTVNAEGGFDVNTEILHRQMSNNSIYYQEKPAKEFLHEHFKKMRYSAEPAWVNSEAADNRRPNFSGVNP